MKPQDYFIYKITCATDKVLHGIYVGQTDVPKKRWGHHLRHLRAGDHHNVMLQRCFDKYGEASLSFEILDTCTAESVTDREQAWADHFRATGRLCNTAPCVETPMRGATHTAETKMRLSSVRKGVPKSSEHREKIRAALSGVPLTEERKQKISTAQKGRSPAAAALRNLREKAVLRRQFTPEQVAQIRAEHKAGATQTSLADKWGAHLQTIGDVVHHYRAYKD